MTPNPDYARAALNYHNERRNEHQVGPLKLDAKLNSIAEKCAKYYVTDVGEIDHSCNMADEADAGENLYETTEVDLDDAELARQACEAWYDEVGDYSYDDPGFDLKTGHFTAMIWKDVKLLGVGVYKSEELAVVVALYTPHPNVEGEFEENVLPKG